MNKIIELKALSDLSELLGHEFVEVEGSDAKMSNSEAQLALDLGIPDIARTTSGAYGVCRCRVCNWCTSFFGDLQTGAL